MNQYDGTLISQNECNNLAISIIDRICIPINKKAENDHELRIIGNIFSIYGIRIKDNMKDELFKDPKNF